MRIARYVALWLTMFLATQVMSQTGGPVAPLRPDAGLGGSVAKDRNATGDADTGAPPAGELITLRQLTFTIPGVVDLPELSGTGIIFGAGISEGYGHVSTNAPGDLSGSISVVQPYVGFYKAGHRHKVLLDYSPTIDLFNQSSWDGSVLQRAAIQGFDDLSEKWRWIFSAYSTYGTEYLRELSAAGMGDYPGWLTFSLPTDTRLVATASTGLQYRRRPLQQLSVNFGNTYGYIRHGAHYETGTARAQITNFFGHQSNWYLYGQSHNYSNQPGCTLVGGGAGLEWNISANTSFFLEGGPEHGNASCLVHLTGNYGGYFAQRFSRRTIVYISASRDLVDPYLFRGKWTDLFSTKLQQQTSRNTTLAAGAGYVLSSVPGVTVSKYRGFIGFSEFRWRLSDSLSLVGSYRYFKREIGDPSRSDRHSWVFLSLVWHPLSRSMRRTY